MQPSRRQLLTAIGSGASVGLVGCLADGSGDDDANDTDGESGDPAAANETADGADTGAQNGSNEQPSFPTEGPLLARLVGPDEEIRLFDRSDVVDVSEVLAHGDSYDLSVTLSEERSTAFLEAIQDLDLEENHDDYEVVLTVDGEAVRQSPITRGLAREWDSGDWEGQFVIQSPAEQAAQRLREALV